MAKNILETLEDIISSDGGVTSVYERKDSDEVSSAFETVKHMNEQQLDQLEKQIGARRERLRVLKEQKGQQNPYKFPEW